MEKVILGCRCNDKEELKKCLELLQKHDITWASNSKIKPNADIRRFFISDNISIFYTNLPFKKRNSK